MVSSSRTSALSSSSMASFRAATSLALSLHCCSVRSTIFLVLEQREAREAGTRLWSAMYLMLSILMGAKTSAGGDRGPCVLRARIEAMPSHCMPDVANALKIHQCLSFERAHTCRSSQGVCSSTPVASERHLWFRQQSFAALRFSFSLHLRPGRLGSVKSARDPLTQAQRGRTNCRNRLQLWYRCALGHLRGISCLLVLASWASARALHQAAGSGSHGTLSAARPALQSSQRCPTGTFTAWAHRCALDIMRRTHFQMALGHCAN